MPAFPTYARNFTSNSNRLHSPNLWRRGPGLDAIRDGYRDGTYFFDDFLDYTLPGTQTTVVAQGRYKAFSAASGQWVSDNMPSSTTAGVADGWISGLCDTDNDAMSIGTEACPIVLSTTGTRKMIFEARIATTSILTNMGQIFCGLNENRVAAFSATVPLGNANVGNASAAMVGFSRYEDGLSVLNTVYGDHSATYGVVQATASTGVLAANTAIKLGMFFNPDDSDRCLRFFVNGLECTTAMTKAAILATTHLDAVGLGPCLAFYADSAGTADYLYLDWWGYTTWV